MSEFLITYLHSIDERLLDYLDEDDELRHEVVKRLRYYASALLEVSITPGATAEDGADWFDLVGAFGGTDPVDPRRVAPPPQGRQRVRFDPY